MKTLKNILMGIITELDKGNWNGNDNPNPHPSLIETMKNAGYESTLNDDSHWSGDSLPSKNEHDFEKHDVFLNQHSWEHHHITQATDKSKGSYGGGFDVKKTKGLGAYSLNSHLTKVHG